MTKRKRPISVVCGKNTKFLQCKRDTLAHIVIFLSQKKEKSSLQSMLKVNKALSFYLKQSWLLKGACEIFYSMVVLRPKPITTVRLGGRASEGNGKSGPRIWVGFERNCWDWKRKEGEAGRERRDENGRRRN